MKRLIQSGSLLVLLSISISVYGQYDTTFHFNGAIKTLGLKVNGIPHYFWNHWNEEGVLTERKLYDNGNVVRKVYYYPNGDKKLQIDLRNNRNPANDTEVKEGKVIKWNKKGLVVHQSNYENNQLHGAMLEWHDNGRKSSSGFYKRGTLVGEWQEWHENGNLKTIGSYDANGEKTGIWYYFNSLEDIILKIDFENAFKDFQVHFTYYYSEGSKKKEGYYSWNPDAIAVNDTMDYFVWKSMIFRQNGPWIFYGEDGRPEKEIVYDFGTALHEESYK